MNFLSHFYFERFTLSSERVVGAILPDLLKNVNKDYNFHPYRFEDILRANVDTFEIDKGWYTHVEVDRLFHGSPFFLSHSHQLRKILDPIVHDLPIRASFLAHIAVELLLDHLLIREEAVKVERLYDHLGGANLQAIRKYIQVIGVVDVEGFVAFYQQFVQWRYIFDYADLNNLSKSLFNISKRLWSFETTDAHHSQLTDALLDYRDRSMGDYKKIFRDIQDNLTHFP